MGGRDNKNLELTKKWFLILFIEFENSKKQAFGFAAQIGVILVKEIFTNEKYSKEIRIPKNQEKKDETIF